MTTFPAFSPPGGMEKIEAAAAPGRGEAGVELVHTIHKNIRMKTKLPRVRKTYNLPPDLIARVKKVFKVKTETEAIVLALQEMIFMDELERVLRGVAGKFPDFKPLR